METPSDIIYLYRELKAEVAKLRCFAEECCAKIPINIGNGIGLFKRFYRGHWEFKSIIPGNNITITEQNETITINSTGGGSFDCTDLNSCNTDSLPEGVSNLYYTNTRVLNEVTGLNISIFNNNSGYLNESETDLLYYSITNPSNFIDLTSLSAGTGISYNNLTGVITNSLPDQTVSLTQGGTTTITGTYPNFTISSSQSFSSLTTTGSSGSSTLLAGVLNVPTYTLSGLGGEPIITAGTILQYWRGDKTWQTFPTIPSFTPAALTKIDDTNVTLTLGGTPSTALLQDTSLTLGWTGTLADSRITSATTWNNKVTSLTAGTGISIGGTTTVPIITNTSPDLTTVLNSGTGISVTGTYPTFTITNTAPSTTSGTVTSVDMSVPTGLSISGNPITTSGTLALSLTTGYVIPTTTEETNWNTAYSNRITSLTTTGTSGAATLISNTLNIPQYTDQYTGTVTSVTLASGAGISLSGTNPITTSGTITVTNSAPDQTVVLNSGTGISATGTYPNFTITNTLPQADTYGDQFLMYQDVGSSIVTGTYGLGFDRLMTVATGALADGQIIYMLVRFKKSDTILGLKWFQGTQGSYTADNYNGVFIASLSGGTNTIQAISTNDGNIWKGTANTWQTKAFSSSYNVTAGVTYAVGAVYNNSAQVTLPTIYGATQLAVAVAQSADFANSVKLYGSKAGVTTLTVGDTQAWSGLTGSNILPMFFPYK